MKSKNYALPVLIAIAVGLILNSHPALADTASSVSTDIGFFDSLLMRFKAAASGWAGIMESAASWLFWTLATISLIVTFGFMALKKADVGEFFAEFIRFTITTGFYFWLLTNGAKFGTDIVFSLSQLGAKAAGFSVASGSMGLTPSNIVGMGFDIFSQLVDNMSLWPSEIAYSLIGAIMALAILLMMCLIGINMLILLVSVWFMGYAGIFFLGFGGSRWTSDIAINYYKSMLGMGAQVMTMVLLLGIGQTFLNEYYATVKAGLSVSNLKAIAALLVLVFLLLLLTSQLPAMVAGIITGSAGGSGMSNMVGMGTLAAAGGMAVAGAAMAGGAMMSAASNAAGSAQALAAAFKGAQANVAAGTDVLSRMAGGLGGGGDSGGGGGGGGGGGQSSPLASAMGLNEGGGGSGGGGGQAATMASAGGGAEDASGQRGASGENQGDQEAPQQTADAKGSGAGEDSSQGGLGAKLSAAGRIAADMGAQLAGGAGRMAQEKAASIASSAQARVADSAMGKFADEIRNPGAQAQARREDAILQQADEILGAQARQDAVAQAHEIVSGNNLSAADADEVASFANKTSPSFDGDSISQPKRAES